MQLLFIDFNHVILTFSFAHDLLLTLIIIVILIVSHELSISLVHHLLLHLIDSIFFNLVLHALNSLIFDVDLLVFISIFPLLHAILTSLVHLLLLLLDGLGDGSLLLWVELVKVGQVFLVEDLLLLLG